MRRSEQWPVWWNMVEWECVHVSKNVWSFFQRAKAPHWETDNAYEEATEHWKMCCCDSMGASYNIEYGAPLALFGVGRSTVGAIWRWNIWCTPSKLFSHYVFSPLVKNFGMLWQTLKLAKDFLKLYEPLTGHIFSWYVQARVRLIIVISRDIIQW